MPRTPFIVIGGFLGAGKTTLLNRWLQDAQGQRLAVLVNDFGAIDIDAALVAQRSGSETIALGNGCVCCAIGDDLAQALMRVLAVAPPFDAIVVESSGVADPWRVAQYALADPALELAAVIVLADASTLLAQAADPLLTDTLVRPLRHADLVLLNKVDLCSAAALEAARAWVDAQASGVSVLPTAQAALPWAAVSGAGWHVARGTPAQGAVAMRPADHGAQFESWSAAPQGRFDEHRLRAWLRDLPPGVLRLKGWLRSGEAAWFEVQFAGRRGSLRRAPGAPPGGAALVAIGLGGQLPVPALEQGLARCAAVNAPEHARAAPHR
ncbi:MAG: GTP-binding protein [Rubrivivax sp.]|nr:GTP-binding protein [Rubrivivax sp.]